jgi:hypothetical protein
LVYVKNSLKIPPYDGRIIAEMRIGAPYNKENSEKTVLMHLLVQIIQLSGINFKNFELIVQNLKIIIPNMSLIF